MIWIYVGWIASGVFFVFVGYLVGMMRTGSRYEQLIRDRMPSESRRRIQEAERAAREAERHLEEVVEMHIGKAPGRIR